MRVWCIRMLPKAEGIRAHAIPNHLRRANFLNVTIEKQVIGTHNSRLPSMNEEVPVQ